MCHLLELDAQWGCYLRLPSPIPYSYQITCFRSKMAVSLAWCFFCCHCLPLLLSLALPLHLAYGKPNSDVHVFSIHDMLPKSICSSSEASASSNSSRLQVVHRHGPCSPFSDGPKVSHGQLLDTDQARVDTFHVRVSAAAAAAHVDKLSSSPAVTIPARTGIPLGTGNYLVTVGFGTPRRDSSVIFDTGSDVTWIQCAPCNVCYTQEEPVFDPAESSTYSAVPCSSADCGRLDSHSCSAASTCRYDVQYGDNSQTQGTFGRDTLSLSTSPSDVLPDFEFGCGDANSGLFGRSAGLIGLGRGSVSLVSQAARKYGAAFSYCLPSGSSSVGYLTIGRRSPANTKYTPMLTVPGLPSFYFVSLTAIKVGGKPLPIPKTVFSTAGTLVDSGTVITRLPPTAYAALRTAFSQRMAQYSPAPALAILDTCYNFTGYEKVAVPTVELVFGRGATLNVDFSGILYVASVSQACLAFAANDRADDVAIIGNVQQRTHNVVYDVIRRKIGFGAKACN
ncbi:aspartyl protease family protein [Canna indica]|uniref:Aspartyl protease family protein n=1 Tax=Canna indica TaxID=4628 RepID=A0AAQ3L3J8_9LILI|nr:aspartyl protease family protein [Canna indica]